ncbi:MAG: DegT/DnrJ/EryC1/StrS family aminotransferase [Candidatus Pacebacteria bacterium]|nr:DegT/DnrJ/EryC1/StrS family aminotransferase [Candidatus Paceibacterota bacterium]
MLNKPAILGGKPTLDKPLPPYNSIGREEIGAINRLLKSGKDLSGFLGRGGEKFLGGPYVKKLENDFEKKFGVNYAVSFNSATTALQAAVAALGIGPGDQVITSPFTMPATATAILFNNAVPVFADIDPKTYCLSAESIAKKITKKTKAILIVNIFGGTPDYVPILKLAKKHNLKIIEDSAQAPGANYRGKFAGTIGDIGVYSFNVHKVIQVGEGGMMVTNNKRYAYRAQLMRNHGEAVMDDVWEKEPKTRELIAGNNFRLTELQAAVMAEQFKKLDKLNNQRIMLADYLTKKLKKFSWLEPASVLPNSKHVYYLYPIKFFSGKLGISRKTFAKAMEAEGFKLAEGYQKPIYLMPIYQKKRIYERSQFPFVSKEFSQNISYKKGDCPVAERMFEKEFLTTTLCQPPKNKAHIDLFIKALQKIGDSAGLLKKYEK